MSISPGQKNLDHPLAKLQGAVRPRNRQVWDYAFRIFCMTTALVSIVILAVLLFNIVNQGLAGLTWHFLEHYPEPDAASAGIGPAIWGTVWVCAVCGLLALPIGVATAIFLEEFRPINLWLRRFHSFIQLNINNLAGVPSVVYGILGLTLFVTMEGLFGTPQQPLVELGVDHFDQFFSAGGKALLVPIADPQQPPTVVTKGMKALTVDGQWVDVLVAENRRKLPRDEESRQYALLEGREAGRISKASFYYFRIPFGRSVLAGGLTLMLVILPIVIISTQEALRAVPALVARGRIGACRDPMASRAKRNTAGGDSWNYDRLHSGDEPGDW